MSTIIELETQPVGLVRIDAPGKQIIVGTMNNAVHSFHVKVPSACLSVHSCNPRLIRGATQGKKRHTLYMPAPIVDIGLISIDRSRITKVLMVALATGEIRFFNGKSQVASLKLASAITAFRFGPYQRNDNTLACVFKDGALAIKMLRRQATLEATDERPGPPPEQGETRRVARETGRND